MARGSAPSRIASRTIAASSRTAAMVMMSSCWHRVLSRRAIEPMLAYVETLHCGTMRLRFGLLLVLTLIVGQAWGCCRPASAQTAPTDIKLERPRLTTLELGRQRLRGFVMAHAVPSDEDARRELYSRLATILKETGAGDADFVWTLAQRWARSTGELDFSALLALARAGWVADFQRYWAVTTLNRGERCRLLHWASDMNDRATELANALGPTIACQIDPPQSPSPASANPAPADDPGPIQHLRRWISEGCWPQWHRCRLVGGSAVVSDVIWAYRRGEGEAALEMLHPTHDRGVLIRVNALLIAEMLKRSDRKNLSIRVDNLVTELDLADADDRQWMAGWTSFYGCVWEKKSWTDENWGHVDGSFGCANEPIIAAALHLARSGETEMSARVARSFHRFVERTGAASARSWAWTAVALLASGAGADAETVYERSLAAVQAGDRIVGEPVAWFVMLGKREWTRRLAERFIAQGQDGLSLQFELSHWATGAIVVGDSEELSRAIEPLGESEERSRALNSAILAAAATGTLPVPSIVDVMVREIGRVATISAPIAQNLAVALRAYGAEAEAQAAVRAQLPRMVASTSSQGYFEDTARWALRLILAQEPDFDSAALLAMAPSRENYVAILRAVALVAARRKDFSQIVRLQPAFSHAKIELLDGSYDSVWFWQRMAMIYAAEGDLVQALGIAEAVGLLSRQGGHFSYSQLVDPWLKAITLTSRDSGK